MVIGTWEGWYREGDLERGSDLRQRQGAGEKRPYFSPLQSWQSLPLSAQVACGPCGRVKNGGESGGAKTPGPGSLILGSQGSALS